MTCSCGQQMRPVIRINGKLKGFRVKPYRFVCKCGSMIVERKA